LVLAEEEAEEGGLLPWVDPAAPAEMAEEVLVESRLGHRAVFQPQAEEQTEQAEEAEAEVTAESRHSGMAEPEESEGQEGQELLIAGMPVITEGTPQAMGMGRAEEAEEAEAAHLMEQPELQEDQTGLLAVRMEIREMAVRAGPDHRG
jgi:hypothetical protein